MGHDHAEDLTFDIGTAQQLPATLAATRHLTLTLLELDASAGTATFEMHNPDAQPDEMVSGLIEQNEESVEDVNRRRDRLHLPEKPVPVDTETKTVETIAATLHEKLLIGDRVWTVSAIDLAGVTLTPGHDHEAHTLLNEVEGLDYQPATIAVAEAAGAIDDAI
ncbi:MAG TPA: hypothetical protein VHZ06_09470 [Marmoricola sp.]|jgi:hypothetical protein|nr:hypothetical protein [Marmoricola sp.]